MNAKAKAIVISHKTAREIIEYENANQGVFTEKQMKELRYYFTAQENQPTLDDAIKVVEKELKRLNNLTEIDITPETYLMKFDEVYLILTALKGLKEGK